MKVVLEKEEAVILASSMLAISKAHLEVQRFIDQQNGFIRLHKEKQEKVVNKIRKRVKDCPKTPLWSQQFPQPVWNLRGINPVTFEGSVEIPEDKKQKEIQKKK